MNDHEMELDKQTILEFAGQDSLEQVEYLVLRGLNLRDISALCFTPNLLSVSLSHNSLTTLKLGGPGLPLLTELNVNSNQLSNLDWVTSTPMLKKLYASNNNFKVLDPLARCGKLEMVCMHGNQIENLDTALEVLAALPGLVELELDGNPCESVKGYRHVVVDKLTQLKRLDCTSVLESDKHNAKHFVAYEERAGTFWTHSDIEVPEATQRPSSAATRRRPTTSHQDSKRYRDSINKGPSNQSLGNSLAKTSMAYLDSVTESFRDQDEPAEKDDRLFRDDFLNQNPILIEYMAQAALSDDTSGNDEESAGAVVISQQNGSSGQRDSEEDEIKLIDMDKSAQRTLDRSSTASSVASTRPQTREGGARKSKGFATELRQVTSALSTAEAFSVEEIANLLKKAENLDPHSSLAASLEKSLRPASRSGANTERPGSALAGSAANVESLGDSSGLVRRLLKTIEKLQSKVPGIEPREVQTPRQTSAEVDELKRTVEKYKLHESPARYQFWMLFTMLRVADVANVASCRLTIENSNMHHLKEENAALRKQLTHMQEILDSDTSRQQNARLKTLVKHYKAQASRLREEAASLGRPMTSAGTRAKESEDTEALLAEVEDYDEELAQLVRRNVTMLSEIKEDLYDTQRALEVDEGVD